MLPGFLLSKILFRHRMYLHLSSCAYRRYLFSCSCISNQPFFKLADTFEPPHHVQLHLLRLEKHHCRYSPSTNGIFIARKSIIADTRHQQMASSLPGKSPSQILPTILSCDYILCRIHCGQCSYYA